MFNKENFISATFTSGEYRYAEVLYTHNDKIHPHIVDTSDLEHPDTKRLLELYSMDELHETTYNSNKEQRQAFENTVMKIAKSEDLISQLTGMSDVIKMLFKEEENERDAENNLFELKLAVFELDIIKDSKAKKRKTDLRKAKTKLEVLKIAFQFMK